ncbi:MAG: thioesterase family protein [Holophagaceae bacterium]
MDEKVPFTHPIEVRFRDLDALGHVNNAVLVTFLEHARWQWWHAYLGERPFADEGFLIARIEVDYRRPILIEDHPVVEVRVSRLGTTSFDLVYRVLSRRDGAVLAEAKTVQVMMDPAFAKTVPIRAETRAWMERQP